MAAEDSSPLTPADTRRAHSKEFSVAAQAFRRVAKPSASGHHLLRSILAMLALPYNAAVEQPILAYRTAGARFSLYDQYKSLTAIRREAADRRDTPVLVVRSALTRLDRTMKAFFSRVLRGKAPGFPLFRGRSRYRPFSVDNPKTARCAIRIFGG